MCKKCGCNAPVREWPEYSGIKICPVCEEEFTSKSNREVSKERDKRRWKQEDKQYFS